MSFVSVSIEPSIIYVVLTRKDKCNALSTNMLIELIEVFDSLKRYTPRLVVFSSTGHVFCAGIDICEVAMLSVDRAQPDLQRMNRYVGQLFLEIFTSPHWVTVLVQGDVYGGGLGILAAADYVIAKKDVRLSFSELNYCMVPGQVYPYLENKLGAYANMAILQQAVLCVDDERLRSFIAYVCSDTVVAIAQYINTMDSSYLSALISTKKIFNSDKIVTSKYIQTVAELFAQQACVATDNGVLDRFLEN